MEHSPLWHFVRHSGVQLMRHRAAAVAAGLYLCAVLGTYIWAAIVHDEFGFAFLPFVFLTLPWSLLVYPIGQHISQHALAAATYALLCVLLSGVNASILYFLIVRASALFRKTRQHSGM